MLKSFEDARAYVRTLGLKSVKEWWAWSASCARPHDIPGHPHATYASSGWTLKYEPAMPPVSPGINSLSRSDDENIFWISISVVTKYNWI
ncbi:methyltransferase domain-containing protein [Pycnococcus provasolii]